MSYHLSQLASSSQCLTPQPPPPPPNEQELDPPLQSHSTNITTESTTSVPDPDPIELPQATEVIICTGNALPENGGQVEEEEGEEEEATVTVTIAGDLPVQEQISEMLPMEDEVTDGGIPDTHESVPPSIPNVVTNSNAAASDNNDSPHLNMPMSSTTTCTSSPLATTTSTSSSSSTATATTGIKSHAETTHGSGAGRGASSSSVGQQQQPQPHRPFNRYHNHTYNSQGGSDPRTHSATIASPQLSTATAAYQVHHHHQPQYVAQAPQRVEEAMQGKG